MRPQLAYALSGQAAVFCDWALDQVSGFVGYLDRDLIAAINYGHAVIACVR